MVEVCSSDVPHEWEVVFYRSTPDASAGQADEAEPGVSCVEALQSALATLEHRGIPVGKSLKGLLHFAATSTPLAGDNPLVHALLSSDPPLAAALWADNRVVRHFLHRRDAATRLTPLAAAARALAAGQAPPQAAAGQTLPFHEKDSTPASNTHERQAAPAHETKTFPAAAAAAAAPSAHRSVSQPLPPPLCPPHVSSKRSHTNVGAHVTAPAPCSAGVSSARGACGGWAGVAAVVAALVDPFKVPRSQSSLRHDWLARIPCDRTVGALLAPPHVSRTTPFYTECTNRWILARASGCPPTGTDAAALDPGVLSRITTVKAGTLRHASVAQNPRVTRQLVRTFGLVGGLRVTADVVVKHCMGPTSDEDCSTLLEAYLALHNTAAKAGSAGGVRRTLRRLLWHSAARGKVKTFDRVAARVAAGGAPSAADVAWPPVLLAAPSAVVARRVVQAAARCGAPSIGKHAATAAGDTLLMRAAQRGDLPLVEWCLASDLPLGSGSSDHADDEDPPLPRVFSSPVLVGACPSRSDFEEFCSSGCPSPLSATPALGPQKSVLAYVNQQNDRGATALLMAAGAGHDAVCLLLLRYGADASRAGGRSSETALLRACKRGHPAVVRTILRETLGAAFGDGCLKIPHDIPATPPSWRWLGAGADPTKVSSDGLTAGRNPVDFTLAAAQPGCKLQSIAEVLDALFDANQSWVARSKGRERIWFEILSHAKPGVVEKLRETRTNGSFSASSSTRRLVKTRSTKLPLQDAADSNSNNNNNNSTNAKSPSANGSVDKFARKRSGLGSDWDEYDTMSFQVESRCSMPADEHDVATERTETDSINSMSFADDRLTHTHTTLSCDKENPAGLGRPLAAAASAAKPHCVSWPCLREYLVDHIDHANDAGETPLSFAAAQGEHLKWVPLLVKLGASVALPAPKARGASFVEAVVSQIGVFSPADAPPLPSELVHLIATSPTVPHRCFDPRYPCNLLVRNLAGIKSHSLLKTLLDYHPDLLSTPQLPRLICEAFILPAHPEETAGESLSRQCAFRNILITCTQRGLPIDKFSALKLGPAFAWSMPKWMAGVIFVVKRQQRTGADVKSSCHTDLSSIASGSSSSLPRLRRRLGSSQAV
ncbi:hypothetical protein DIPPA_15025 [Diplonema papillatum]|nr:hypothetical protein DIPPA_15025 [Diplonema papillatum]